MKTQAGPPMFLLTLVFVAGAILLAPTAGEAKTYKLGGGAKLTVKKGATSKKARLSIKRLAPRKGASRAVGSHGTTIGRPYRLGIRRGKLRKPVRLSVRLPRDRNGRLSSGPTAFVPFVNSGGIWEPALSSLNRSGSRLVVDLTRPSTVSMVSWSAQTWISDRLEGVLEFGGIRSGPADCTGRGDAPAWADADTSNSYLDGLRSCIGSEGELAVLEFANNRPYGVLVRYGGPVEFGWVEDGLSLGSVIGGRNLASEKGFDGLYLAPGSRGSVGIRKDQANGEWFKTGVDRGTAFLDFVRLVAGGPDVFDVFVDPDPSAPGAAVGCVADAASLVVGGGGIVTDINRDTVFGFMKEAALSSGCALEISQEYLRRKGAAGGLKYKALSVLKKAAAVVGAAQFAATATASIFDGLDSAAGSNGQSFSGGQSYFSVKPKAAAQPAPTPDPEPLKKRIEVFNKLTNGSSGYREDPTPARLTTKPWKNCGSRGCNVNGTERVTGQTYYPAVCWTTGDLTTNGENGSSLDDAYQYTSDRYYGVTHDGTVRFISWVWIHSSHRGGLGLPHC